MTTFSSTLVIILSDHLWNCEDAISLMSLFSSLAMKLTQYVGGLLFSLKGQGRTLVPWHLLWDWFECLIE
jgi:hypothetical protein